MLTQQYSEFVLLNSFCLAHILLRTQRLHTGDTAAVRPRMLTTARDWPVAFAPSIAQITVGVVFRWIGRSYPVTGIELNRRGGGAGHASASDRGGPHSALGNAMNVAYWHNPDLQRPLELGPIMATLPTFGAECRFFTAFQTQRHAVLKVAV